ncbi:hypothetical protein FRC14_006814 [Serendipita sp. 396]|nr:hypothetical protein FRC14_006814 [Serendipita sp. 396]KAG8865711.1 hypothetical protein FRC20_009563 [Serendipita sp. 405]KAG9047679.1 hypothetical protein FS842_000597 [Serendipita sp. 407]
MNLFALLRLCILGTILLFSVIVMGLAANLTANTITLSFPGFAVAVSVLTIIALTPILVIDRLRKGSFLSWVVVEFGVSAVLWVLWLASASLTTSSGLFTGDCGIWISSRLESFCRQYSAVQAFSWLNWLLFKVYGILLLVLAILAAMKGHKRVWFSPASDLSFSPTHTHSGEPKIPPPGAVPYQNTGGSPMPYNTTGGSYNAGPNPNPAYPGYVPQGQYAPPAGSPQPSYGAPYGSPVPPPPNPHASHV